MHINIYIYILINYMVPGPNAIKNMGTHGHLQPGGSVQRPASLLSCVAAMLQRKQLSSFEWKWTYDKHRHTGHSSARINVNVIWVYVNQSFLACGPLLTCPTTIPIGPPVGVASFAVGVVAAHCEPKMARCGVNRGGVLGFVPQNVSNHLNLQESPFHQTLPAPNWCQISAT